MALVLTSFTGGIDSTGSQMEWVLLHLARNPKLLKRLQDEIDAVVGKERPLEEADLPALPFLNAVLFLHTTVGETPSSQKFQFHFQALS